MIVVAIIGLLAADRDSELCEGPCDPAQANALHVNNMRQIDAAENEWALELGKTTGASAPSPDL